MRILVVLICFVCSLNARIIEMPNFEHLSQYVDEKTLLILDIDDTLLITKQMLGCDEWFKHRLNINQKKLEGNFQHALDLTLFEWEGIRHITEMEIVEPGLVKVVHDLQKKPITLMGLTTQSLSLSKRTAHQLKSHYLDLSITAPEKRAYHVFLDDHDLFFNKGILFTDGAHKGKAFFQFCDHVGYLPKRIVFVNDKASHIKEIEDEAIKRNIEFLGLRYAYSDAKKEVFSQEIADFQFHNSSFHRLLTDDEAKELMTIEKDEG